jgi:hypothetical protein
MRVARFSTCSASPCKQRNPGLLLLLHTGRIRMFGAAVTMNWRGGSVRRLRRIIEAILRERDIRAPRN